MSKKTKESVVKVGKVAIAVLVGAMLGVGGAGLTMQPEVVTKEVPVEVQVPYEVQVPVEVQVPFETIKEVEVPVDNGKLATVLDYVDETEGNLADVYDEARGSSDIVDVIVFDVENRKLAVDAIRDELFDELDNEDVTVDTDGNVVSISLDEDDMKRLKINDDFEDVELVSIDFKDGQAEYEITGTFEQDGDKFEFVSRVEFDDAEVDDVTVTSVKKRA